MTRVRLTGRLICSTHEDAALVHALLPEHIRASRAEPGCLGFDVTPESCGLVWVVSEEFFSEAAFAAHQTRTKASAWGRATAHITRDFTKICLP